MAKKDIINTDRERVLHVDAVCFYCGGDAECIDHKIPKSKGGLSELINYVACCHECNSIKSVFTFEEHRIRADMISTGRVPFSKRQIDYLTTKGVGIPKEFLIKFHGENNG